MKALVIAEGALRLEDRETPAPAADQVLVEVAGTGVNRADLLQVGGRYPAPPGWPKDVPGLELSGTVVAAGPGVRWLSPGDRVFGIVGGGAHASHVLTTENLCTLMPDDLDPIAAGGIPEVFITAHDALVTIAGLKPGERVLVHGVGSGVGTAAVQIARAMGATSVGTARTPGKLEKAKELGLDEGVVAGGESTDAIGEVDVVVDLIGGDYLSIDVEVCRPKGRIVIVGLLGGAVSELNLGAVMQKRLSIRGTVLRSRPDHEKAAAVAAFGAQLVPLFADGRLQPVVDKIVPLEQGQEAYDLVASNATFGKVVLSGGGGGS